MKKKMIIGLLSVLIMNSYCQPLVKDGKFTYNLIQPEAIIELPEELDEISGLAFYQPDQLLAVDDEEEEVFVVDTRSQTITDRISTGKERDYEGVAFANGRIYVLESDGDIFTGQFGQTEKFQKKETMLSREQNTEGLAYDPDTQRLLIASKNDQAGEIQLFQLSLESEDTEVTPWLSIRLGKKKGGLQRSSFRTSAIARHPISKMIYLLSSADQCLAVINDRGEVMQEISLPGSLYPQAEGLCFSPNGTLYICNEGKSNVSNILIFSPN